MEENIVLNEKKDEPLFELTEASPIEKAERKIKVQERRIKGLQNALSRCVEGSNNSKKIMAKIEKAKQKIENTKRYLEKCLNKTEEKCDDR